MLSVRHVVAVALGGAGGGGTIEPPTPAPTPGPIPGPVLTRFPAKLQVARAQVTNGRLDVLAPISGRASGKVRIAFDAAGRTTRFTQTLAAGAGRLRIAHTLPRVQARKGTGIFTIEYPGNARTRPQTVRLRAASGRSALTMVRPRIAVGRLTAQGTISSRARGVVPVQLSFTTGNADGLMTARARISGGRWKVDVPLPSGARDGGYVTALFTGYAPRNLRGELRALQAAVG